MPCSLSLQATEILAPTCTCTKLNAIYHSLFVKLWPIGVASRGNLKTWVYLQLHLARLYVYMHWHAMTCARFGRDQICMQVKASFTPFGHPTQVNASQVTSISLLLANEIQEMSALKCFFCDLHVLVRKLACLFGHPTRKSLRKFNLPLLTATSEPVWPGL